MGASRWQILWRLRLPSALPYLLGAMKIAGGLSLIGAVVAEFVAGSGTATGLAWRIVEAGNRLEIATMFAALALLAILGIVLFAAFSFLEWAVLHRWHESRAQASKLRPHVPSGNSIHLRFMSAASLSAPGGPAWQ